MIKPIACLLFLFASAFAIAAPTQNQTGAARDNRALDVSSHTSGMRYRSIPYAINANIGFVKYLPTVKPGYWYPIWAALEAKEADVDGVLVFSQSQNTLRVTIPVRATKGEKKLFRSAFKPVPFGQAINVEFRNNRTGSEMFGANCLSVPEDSRHILVVTEEAGAFSFLKKPSASQPLNEFGNPANELFVQYGALDLLPDDPILLESLDAIVLDGAHLRVMRKEQWDAIQTWVAMGGRLLIGTGRNQPFVQQSALKDPFGIAFAAPEPADLRNILPAQKGAPTPLQIMAAWPSLPQGAWDTIWIGDPAHPFLAGRRVGRGFVAVCAAALDRELMNTINEEPNAFHIWEAMLGQARASTPLMEIARHEEGKLSLGLQMPFGFGMASAWWVAAYLGLYVVIAMPAAWVISTRLRRRGWFWLAAAALALVFAWYAYNSGSLSRERSILLNEATLISRPAATGPARAVTLSSVYAPWRYRKDIRVGARILAGESKPGYDPRFGRFTGGRETDLYSDRPLIASFGAVTDLRDFAIYPSSARNLRTDFTAGVEGGITVLALLQGVTSAGSLSQGRIRNATPWTFTRWWIVGGQNKVWTPSSIFQAGAEHDFARVTALSVQNPGGPMAPTYRFSARGNAVLVDVPYFRSIFGSAFYESFIREPESATSRRIGNPYYQSQSGWNWQWMTESWPRMDGALLFIGECEDSLSPVTEPLHLNPIRRRLYYEQTLDEGDTPGARRAGQAPSSWQAKMMDETLINLMTNMGFRLEASNGSDVLIYLTTIDVSLFPDTQFYPKSGESAEISFTLKDYHEDPQTVNPYYLRMPGRQFIMPQGTHIAGCPVSIYNRRLDKWEPVGVWTGQPCKLKNLIEYIHPATSAISLRLEAIPDEVRYSVASSSAAGAPALKTGKEIFGSQTPLRTQSQNFQYNNPQPYPKGPSVAVLSDLKVKIIPFENKPENPQDGKRR